MLQVMFQGSVRRRAAAGLRVAAPVAAGLLLAALAGSGAKDPGLSAPALQRDVRILSSDAFEGRAPLSAGEARTIAYIRDAMRAAGLKPGAGGSYFQPVPLVQIETRPDPRPLFQVEGPRGSLALTYGRDTTLNTRRELERIAIADAGVVFAGYGITAPERQWDDYAGVDVRGKIVLVLVNDPDWREALDRGPFGGARMTYYGRWNYKFAEAARRGAAAAVIIHEDSAAGYPFKVLTSSLTGPRMALKQPGAAPVAAEAWITRDAAARLLALAGENLGALEAAARTPGFRARPLDLRGTIRFGSLLKRGVSSNVVGVLPGAKRAGDYVLYTAHWDHLGRCPADESGDDICNGAIDNASGVGGLLELARAYGRARPPQRSVVFMATTAEEYGLLGSEHYARQPLYPLAQTVAQIDIDPLSFMSGRMRDVSLIADQTDLAAIVRRVAAAQGRVVTPDSAPELGNRYRSDTLSFARAGVPVVYLGSGIDLPGRPAGSGQAAQNDYYRTRYHSPADAYDPSWDWSGAVEDLALYYGIGRALADGDDWPNWFPADEFRGARDAVRRSASGARPAGPPTPDAGERADRMGTGAAPGKIR